MRIDKIIQSNGNIRIPHSAIENHLFGCFVSTSKCVSAKQLIALTFFEQHSVNVRLNCVHTKNDTLNVSLLWLLPFAGVKTFIYHLHIFEMLWANDDVLISVLRFLASFASPDDFMAAKKIQTFKILFVCKATFSKLRVSASDGPKWNITCAGAMCFAAHSRKKPFRKRFTAQIPSF